MSRQGLQCLWTLSFRAGSGPAGGWVKVDERGSAVILDAAAATPLLRILPKHRKMSRKSESPFLSRPRPTPFYPPAMQGANLRNPNIN